AANNSPVAAEWRISKADARSKVLVVGVRPRGIAVALRAEHQGPGQIASRHISLGQVQVRSVVVSFVARGIHIPAKSQIQCELTGRFEIILHKQRVVMREPPWLVSPRADVSGIHLPKEETCDAVSGLGIQTRHRSGFASGKIENTRDVVEGDV